MTIEKMREEFEAHYAKEFSEVSGYKVSGEEISTMREGDWYGDRPYLNGYWKGWQASRENLVVELPPIPYRQNPDPDTHQAMIVRHAIRRACKAAGVSCK